MTVNTVRTVQGQDIGPQINALAAREQCDTRGFVALLISESGLDERARRPVDPADDATFWPDVSGGLGQQTVAYAAPFGLGDGSATRANIDAVMAVLMTDVDQALDIAAQQYGAFYRQTGDYHEAVARYNGGSGASWATIPAANRANYERGWAAAAEYEIEEPPVPPIDHSAILTEARTWLGVPYVWGGQSRDGIDCSGLVIEVLIACGLWPWGDDTAAGIANRLGLRQDWDAIHDGDLLFYDYGDGQGIVHIGFRDGYQHTLDALQPGTVVSERALSAYELDRLAGFACPGSAPAPAPPPPPDPAPPDDWEARWGALENLRGFLQGDVADALDSALARARAATTLEARAAAFADLAAAISTLRNAGK